MNKNRLEKVKNLATKLHFGQKRKDGADYITHPIAVAEIAKNKLFALNFEIVLAICYLHDVLEDCDIRAIELVDELIKIGYSRDETKKIFDAVYLLTRPSKELDVLVYLKGIKTNPYAVFVKICDLEHNMSDLAPSNLLDKYKLFYYILTKHC
jgi:(p)ppGpp synthase/HD superfamily hydrolase